MQVKDLINYLITNYGPDDNIVAPCWAETDIYQRAKERQINVDDAALVRIIDRLEGDHDANKGITWDVIDELLDAHCAETAEVDDSGY